MNLFFIKDNVIKKISNIHIKVIIDDKNVTKINPTLEEIIADGWKPYPYSSLNPTKEEIHDVVKSKLNSLTMDSLITSHINTFNLTNNEALSVKELYPEWKVNIDVKTRERYQDNDLLWECLQDHKTQDNWRPSLNTASLWKVVNEEHEGTIEDPIPYTPPMELFENKYYSQYKIIYKCIRDSQIPLNQSLQDLINIYVEKL